MMEGNKDLVNTQIKALHMLKKDYEKLYARALKKREKELEKLRAKAKQMDWDEDSLQEAYGWGQITQKQYESILAQLRESDNQKINLESAPTALTEYLRMVKQEINNVSMEIEELGGL